ncbi:50S ribosomal protein L16 [Candidatus Roizmanbacteria bacterium RIFCSPLOWO2_12_FULL_40_12]|uniref:50S ribosomal protein L16 n=1 Tax=Candidatus Roizmanbacteria bacterium RIFCSPLOWO2_01_FULL_40_42 TaxID=1802066 RepID=A0A1F7J4H3_9BACT|nr:MAG: 50S ribosomal protein L16 [Candidatus Roizmanbacteria bacterium RIFCSPHIGHO2_01_FULL_40_98]OGK27277.1 MAG: 50S ribosomal protein L16 [Candidatus Roizmanbacteria bacterium RIFCSPHIGHO2_02_FULL_40_53]OGK30851.1 MAG: 50S ribosomal protein L16 [Candidatus Roizmanbacteria bacterium RIFCSPHIGHO2_12_41_18]OGK36382.1 MAG: 50S ribosomal protein L16 [Candidatus Roizmanbacteria bacterium RIFCSPHIGHO2_12_FULL_40_130]OGK50510.1 MAG: 50S ribosomal protein L16 [Candidatus Roizmanbacteria bacterium RIF
MLAPKRQKYRKQFRGSWRRIAVKGEKLNFGNVGLKAITPGWIKDREIEATRVVLARATRKSGKYWIRIFPDKPFTKKPPEVTMGSGKGEVSHFVASVTPGRVLFEIDGLDEAQVKNVFRVVSSKLSVRTKIIHKNI